MVWEVPPNEGWLYAAEAVELRNHPGKWGVVSDPDFDWLNPQQAYNVAYSIKQGKYKSFQPAGDFDACGRVVDGKVKLFVRFVGEARDARRS